MPSLRAIFVPGTWQLVTAAAALAEHHEEARAREEDVLVLFGPGLQPSFKKAMESVAQAVWPWRRVVWADDVLLCHFPTRLFAPVARRILHDRIGSRVDEVWVAKLHTDPPKLAAYAYPRSRIVIYEDGAEEFIDQDACCGRERLKSLGFKGLPGGLRREWSHWTKASECLELTGLCARDKKRVAAKYSYLARFLDWPPHLAGVPAVQIEKDRLLGRLRALTRSRNEKASIQGGSDTILFLPQPFAEPGSLTDQEEFALYRDAIGDLLKKGYRALWKEHPRQVASFWPRLREAVSSDRLVRMEAPAGMPVEALVEGWKLAGVVSVSSSALFYLKGLYGFPAYTLAGRVPRERWRQPVDARLAEIFEKKLPGLEALPDLAQGTG